MTSNWFNASNGYGVDNSNNALKVTGYASNFAGSTILTSLQAQALREYFSQEPQLTAVENDIWILKLKNDTEYNGPFQVKTFSTRERTASQVTETSFLMFVSLITESYHLGIGSKNITEATKLWPKEES